MKVRVFKKKMNNKEQNSPNIRDFDGVKNMLKARN